MRIREAREASLAVSSTSNFRYGVMALFACLIILILVGQSKGGVPGDREDDDTISWYDCAGEMGIDRPKLVFSEVYSDPPVVYKNSGQILYKTITYPHDDSDDPPSLEFITADLTQMFHLFDKYWVPFVKAPLLDQCTRHDGTTVDQHGNVDGPLCPLATSAKVFSVHAPFSRITPYGEFRSRQVYRDANQQIIGCLDTRLLYCETPDHPKGSASCTYQSGVSSIE